MIVPKITNNKPIIFPTLKSSPKNTIPMQKTIAGAKLMKG